MNELCLKPVGSGGVSGAAKALELAGLAFLDLLAGAFFALTAAVTAVPAALTAASAAAAVCLLGGFEPYTLIPELPYWCGAVLGFALLALSVLSAVGSVYSVAFVRRFSLSYGRFRHNRLAFLNGGTLLAPVSLRPEFSEKTGRRLKKLALASLAVFAVYFVAGFAACAVSAGAPGFWHVWSWFVR